MQQVLWPDAHLDLVTVDYDAVTLWIHESTGRLMSIRCEGHIGYALDGFWDELYIERVELVEEHPAIERCLKSLSTRIPRWGDSGNEDRNTRRWKALVIHLGDDAFLEVVAARFRVEVVKVPPTRG